MGPVDALARRQSDMGLSRRARYPPLVATMIVLVCSSTGLLLAWFLASVWLDDEEDEARRRCDQLNAERNDPSLRRLTPREQEEYRKHEAWRAREIARIEAGED